MNNTTKLLTQACEMEKAAFTGYLSSLTQSMLVNLVKGGVPFEKAASITKEACSVDATVVSYLTNISAFEKVAEYVDELETQVAELQKVAGAAQAEVVKLDQDNPFNKLAAAGFSPEEIEMMHALPNQLVEKVASNNSQPWEMGGAVGIPREKTDPLLEFLLG